MPAHKIAVLPSGHLHLVTATAEDVAFGIAAELPAKLIAAFNKSAATGLTSLVSSASDGSLPASLQFWRAFANRYFTALRRRNATGGHDWQSPEPPDDETLCEVLAAAPPMLGLEYANPNSLRETWAGLDEQTAAAANKRKGGLAGYLHSLRPEWNLLGRVTFHLAENKKNPDRPFAFLATYTQPESTGRTPRHIPLSEALKASIAAGDTKQLDALLTPVARAAESCPPIANMLESKALFAPQAWGIGQAYEFFTSVPQLEESGVIVRVPDWWNAARPPRPQVTVRVGSKSQSVLGGDSLDLDVDVSVDGQPLSPDEVAALMNAREGMALLRGKWVQVDAEQLESALHQWVELRDAHATGVGFLEGMRLLSGASITGNDVDESLQPWTRIEPGDWLAETLDSLRDPSDKLELDPHNRLNASLRPYQADGVAWLYFATKLGLGVCLADDMGLGKTIQIISLLLQLKYPATKSKKKAPSKNAKPLKDTTANPSLLILPTSLLGNWQREVERFAPDLKLYIAHRSSADASELKRIADNPAKELAGYDLVATTYGLARRQKWLSEVDWNLVILDEAQAIKNSGAAQTKAIKQIPARGRIALSGTPVENHLGDLWSLFDFCSPGLLGTASQFKKFVNSKDEADRIARLASVRRLISPYVLRRMKTDPRIVPDLPQKTEMRVDCGLTTTQVALYKAVTDDLQRSLDIASGIQRRGMVLGALMQLKQICNHPALHLKQSDFNVDASGKYSQLRSIAEALIEKQEKMLVFTQFQSMCGPISEFLSGVFNRQGLVLTGKTATKKRGQLVKQFQEESGPPFFVISVKAGGTGLNLTEASHVVHFDRWWNPAVEDQATDRAFRIGQKRNVLVHKFVCRGTLEERIDDMIRDKKQLSRELFGGDGQDEVQLTEMSNEQLIDFVSLDITKAKA
ncbi:non-specific serine/threonine protein kinase [Neorhodopirellula lusitana]|uniref:Non-specific serine/threonine protein kinase n=1 Tax=Neorhodopirellula lusitana TaxID=445327 RepID=A0ABY1QQV1_9BACT|nr:DEAD/DEAH box helicase [Neorhodopirellula lusitana]SMP76051.1 non-specific serine/threonine protein kinase [Neorhodopirellula lusitana]